MHTRRRSVAERLLILREKAGGDQAKHDRYHVLVRRLQKMILKRYMLKNRCIAN